MQKKLVAIVLIFVLSLISSVALQAQPAATVLDLENYAVAEAVFLPDLIEGVNTETVTLLTDGTMIAWWDDALCLYTFESTSTDCFTPPPDSLERGISPLRWSPDSRYLAFTEDYWIQFNEPDIWLFDTETGKFTNKTEDGTVESPLRGDGVVTVEPIWHPDGKVYFWELVVNPSSAKLNYVLPDNNEVGHVADLAPEISPIGVASFYPPVLGGSTAFSPDGSLVAIATNAVTDDQVTGAWLFDLETESLKQIVSASDIGENLPSEVVESQKLPITGVGWNADSSGIFIMIEVMRSLALPYYYDVESSELTTLIDFADYQLDSDNGLVNATRTAQVVPGQSALFTFHTHIDADPTQASLGVLDIDGNLEFLYELTDYQPVRTNALPSVSADGKILMSGWLFLPETA